MQPRRNPSNLRQPDRRQVMMVGAVLAQAPAWSADSLQPSGAGTAGSHRGQAERTSMINRCPSPHGSRDCRSTVKLAQCGGSDIAEQAKICLRSPTLLGNGADCWSTGTDNLGQTCSVRWQPFPSAWRTELPAIGMNVDLPQFAREARSAPLHERVLLDTTTSVDSRHARGGRVDSFG